MKQNTSLTWFEELFLHFEYKWGRILSKERPFNIGNSQKNNVAKRVGGGSSAKTQGSSPKQAPEAVTPSPPKRAESRSHIRRKNQELPKRKRRKQKYFVNATSSAVRSTIARKNISMSRFI